MTLTAVMPVEEPTADLATTTKVVLVVEYDGTRYHGFQVQGGQPTIQLELEKAIHELTGETLRLITASRTDAGVHARGQVVSFRTVSTHTPETFVKALNYYLPAEIAVKAAYKAADSFNVRRQAISREYNYTILNSDARSPLRDRFLYQVPGKLDIAAMNQAAGMLIGEHDFASFVNNNEVAAKSTVRRVSRSEITREGDLLVYHIEANSFLMHQVRNIVGTLLRVGRGRTTVDEVGSILDARKPGLAWPTAPARGLCLMQVNYENSPMKSGLNA